MRKIGVALFAFNEEAVIGSLVDRVRAVSIPGVELMAVVIDDGSRDKTAEAARARGALVLSHAVNRGVGAAFRTALDWARQSGVEFFIHMDGDGQVLPEEIPNVLRPLLEDRADMTVGSRFLNGRPENMSGTKHFCLHLLARVVAFAAGSYRINDISCGFRGLNRAALSAMRPSFAYDYIQQSIIQAMGARLRLAEVPVTVLYDEQPGASDAMSSHVFRYIFRTLTICAKALWDVYAGRAR